MSRRYSIFFELIRILLGFWLKWKFAIRPVQLDTLQNLTPPFLVIPNHQNTFDPFILAAYIKTPVFWVASDANFRSPFVRFWLRLLGIIPKSKGMTDLESVRMMVDAVKSGGVVGIFAEGERTWDGRTLPLMPATAKLVRMLNVPVLCPVMKGGYVSLPRWSPYIRKGGIEIDFSRVLYPEDIKGMKTAEIGDKLAGLLSHDDYLWQNQVKIPFVSTRSAEFLECLLFMCRSCGEINTLHSQGNELSCSGCGSRWRHDEYSRLTVPGEDPISPGDWYREQLTRFKAEIIRALRESEEITFFIDGPVRVTKGYKSERGTVLGSGEVSLSTAGITFDLVKEGAGRDRMNTNTTLFAPIGKISGENVIYRNQFEFYYNNTLFSCSYEGRPGCGIKWVHGVQYIRDLIPDLIQE